ncbi:MAG: hypothetical protein RLY40_1269 [Pseudomonadota bacterium]|jgi:ubiquinone/menaquinone biosynthesis C-methylase UbiE
MPEKLDRWDPQLYEKNNDFQYDSAMALLKQLPIKQNQNVLDIGCGSGRISAALAKRIHDGNLTGIDFSRKMIEFAKQKYLSIRNLNFIVMDADAMQFNSHGLNRNYYDWVISFWTFSWIKHPEKVIFGITQCLAKKGNIFLLIPCNNSALENTFFELRNKKLWRDINYQVPKNNFCLNFFRDLIEKYEFTNISYKSKKVIKKFSDRGSLINFVRAWLSYLDPIPDLTRFIS